MNENIINYIKKIFSNAVLKGEILSLEELLDKAIDYHAEEKEIKFLKDYYQFIVDFEFINNLDHFEELIFLGEKGFYLKSRSHKELYPFPYSQEDFELMLQIISIKNKIDWNFNTPFASFKLILNSLTFRATLIHASLGNENSCRLFLRKIEQETFPLESFSKNTDLLKDLIKDKKNIIVCGPTGSGKTTLTSSLMEFISKDDHVITIEDTEELIYKNSFYTPLLSSKQTSMDELLAYSLRMTPERIVLGEMRSKEITTFLLAMNTGHRGLLSTLHANSASDAVERMALMFTLYQKGDSLNYQEVIKLISKSVDVIIFIENKEIKEIVKLVGSENGNVYFSDLYSCSNSENSMFLSM